MWLPNSHERQCDVSHIICFWCSWGEKYWLRNHGKFLQIYLKIQMMHVFHLKYSTSATVTFSQYWSCMLALNAAPVRIFPADLHLETAYHSLLNPVGCPVACRGNQSLLVPRDGEEREPATVDMRSKTGRSVNWGLAFRALWFGCRRCFWGSKMDGRGVGPPGSLDDQSKEIGGPQQPGVRLHRISLHKI